MPMAGAAHGAHPALMAYAPGLHRRADLRASGHVDSELCRALRTGVLQRVRPGAYFAGPTPSRAEDRHALLVRATAARLAGDAVVSHVSAAVLHGLPVWNVGLDRVHVTRCRSGGGRQGRWRHVHAASIADDERCVVDGVVVTSPARTVVDLARTVGFEEAVVVADAALSTGMVDVPALAAALRRAARRPGAPAARRAVCFADGRSESVGESRSRVALAGAGLPPPTLQYEVRLADGSSARADFGWPGRRTVGEFDGRAKYGMARPGEQPGDTVFREKLREDALRAQGLAVVRWTWADLARFERVAARIRACWA